MEATEVAKAAVGRYVAVKTVAVENGTVLIAADWLMKATEVVVEAEIAVADVMKMVAEKVDVME